MSDESTEVVEDAAEDVERDGAEGEQEYSIAEMFQLVGNDIASINEDMGVLFNALTSAQENISKLSEKQDFLDRKLVELAMKLIPGDATVAGPQRIAPPPVPGARRSR